MVLSAHLTAALSDEAVDPLDGRSLIGERTDVHDLGRPPLAEALEPHPGERG